MEAAATKEFAKQARAWYLAFAYGQEVAKECEQPHGFGKFGSVARHFAQQRHGIVFHDTQFKKQ